MKYIENTSIEVCFNWHNNYFPLSEFDNKNRPSYVMDCICGHARLITHHIPPVTEFDRYLLVIS
mgnify:CR=1 FL=1